MIVPSALSAATARLYEKRERGPLNRTQENTRRTRQLTAMMRKAMR